MGRTAKVAGGSRLSGSAGAAGGIAFGYWRFVTPGPNPLQTGLAPGAATLNPYVSLAPEGITVIAPRAAMGQGAQSALALLLAEEMDLDSDALRIAHGPPSATSYHGAAAPPALPFVPADHSLPAPAAREARHVAAKVLGLPLTAGPSPTPAPVRQLRPMEPHRVRPRVRMHAASR